ncbi:hypothetical protein D3C85_1285350 [compost metagenome]
MRSFMEEVMENLPVVQRRPVTFCDLNSHQFGAIAVGDPCAVPDPFVRDAINFALDQRLEIHFQQSTIVFDIVEGLIVRRQKTAKGVVTRAFRQLHRFGFFQIQQVVVPVAVELPSKEQVTAIIKEALLIKVVTVTRYFRWGQAGNFHACIRIAADVIVQLDPHTFSHDALLCIDGWTLFRQSDLHVK